MQLQENIKKLRQKHNMTLEEVAKIVGVSKQTIHRYENGVISNIPQDKVEKLAIAFQTTPSELMGWVTNDYYIGDVKYFDKVLKHYREYLHLTQTELDEKNNLPLGTTKSLEDRKTSPTDELLDVFANFFLVAPYALLDDCTGEIFKRIKKIKEHFQLTIEEFADKISIVPDMYTNWEDGISKSYIDYLDRMSNAFDVPIGYLWGNFDESALSGDEFFLHKVLLSPDEEKLFATMKKLNTLGKEEAIKRIEELTYVDKYTKPEDEPHKS